jgi:hypothetical protein
VVVTVTVLVVYVPSLVVYYLTGNILTSIWVGFAFDLVAIAGIFTLADNL